MPVTHQQRLGMVSTMQLLNRYAEGCPYAEVRPMATRGITPVELPGLLAQGRMPAFDCSESVTLICRLNGLSDPNGLGYDGDGYTGTMFDYLEHMDSYGDLHKGSIIIYGVDPTVHVVMVVEPDGDNPLIYSHGSHARSAIWDLKTEDAYHLGQTKTLCAIGKL